LQIAHCKLHIEEQEQEPGQPMLARASRQLLANVQCAMCNVQCAMPSLVILGLALRCYHYLRNPSMWHDEAALVLNVIGKSFAGLLGPLFFSEAAPPLFLWMEKGIACLGGDSTYALRLLPFLGSCAAFFGMAVLARRVLSPRAAFWAVLLFACSDRLLWHCCEAKPYAVDVAVAVVLLLALTYTASWSINRQVLLYACLSPVVIFLSYPACFLLGGMALTLLPAVWQARRPLAWIGYGLFLLALGVSFLLLLAGPIQAQRDEQLLDCWGDMFPSWDRPWTVPGWLAVKCTEVVRYTCEPTGNLLAPVALLGAIGLWRSGQRRLMAFCCWPMVLAALAGVVRQYPFAATRVMVFATPALLLLTAAGLPVAFTRLRFCGWVGPALLAGLCLFPAGQALYRVACPWPRFDSARAASFVRTQCGPGELVVGTSWEHEYYFRNRWIGYRSLIPTPSCPNGYAVVNGLQKETRLWLVAAGKTEEDCRSFLDKLAGANDLYLVGRYEFERTTVYYLARKRRSDLTGISRDAQPNKCSFGPAHEFRQCLEHLGGAGVGQFARPKSEIGDNLSLDEQKDRHVGGAAKPVTGGTNGIGEHAQGHVANGVVLAPAGDLVLKRWGVLGQEGDPAAQIRFLVLGQGLVEQPHQLA
jgi:hypothetical protein